MAVSLPNGAVVMFDGPDWIGKTTQVNFAAKSLVDQSYKVLTTRVNGGSPIGEALRAVMLGDYERPVMTDLLIHMAQQYALCIELARHRQEGMAILVDRSPMSIIAYQIYGEGLDEATGYKAADEVMTLYQPELLIAYTAPQKIIQERRKTANREEDYFERQSVEYFERVAEGYAVAAKRYGAHVVDASHEAGMVHAETMQPINAALMRVGGNTASA